MREVSGSPEKAAVIYEKLPTFREHCPPLKERGLISRCVSGFMDDRGLFIYEGDDL
jgi:hypothetical protein